MNKNTVTNPRYLSQQKAVREICEELGLIPFYPNYHGKGNDNNTVLIYTREDEEYNKALSSSSPNETYRTHIGYIENSDPNGFFSLDYLNRGKVCFIGLNEKEKIKAFILEMLERHNESH